MKYDVAWITQTFWTDEYRVGPKAGRRWARREDAPVTAVPIEVTIRQRRQRPERQRARKG